ncbi:histidinol-phosphate transaminase [Alkalibacter rhizosphaerae]|uniref:Histidinol-phosphate aminotransferase n=1 Tax=Alkalibacter rhizosphaerae TaxID=2815577 RepID=A0A975AGQ6_9FIRM|nr:histidinol-phosphate transaminase [Alkalibacter rhizosphaerae]QSX07627.1 histidinol-phosphate transaminase [Alkalibacter rhizosphaerae]
MRNMLSRLAQELEPYVPGEQPVDKVYVKLNTNENPYPPSDRVLAAIHGAVDRLRLYPDPENTELKEVLATYWNSRLSYGSPKLETENFFVGNGSDEVLGFAFPAFFTDREVAFADITYSFYPVYAKLFHCTYREIPLDEDFQIPVEEFVKLAKEETPPAGILLANPNAPTGRGLSKEDVEKIIRANEESVVLVDEAYIDFGGESVVDLVREYDNLLVVQTLSKSRSLAGLRVGYAVGSETLIDGLNRVKNSFNSYTVDRLAMAGAVAAICDESHFQRTRHLIMETRSRVTEKLEEMGFNVVESEANFIFVTHKSHPAKDLFQGLREKGVLVRYFNKPRIDNYLRITIGTDGEMDILLHALEELLA